MTKLCMTFMLAATTFAVNAERVKATFTIVDDWGAPVTNASVKILTPRHAYTLSWNKSIPYSEYNTKTDEKGCATCSFASPQRRFSLCLYAPGFYYERQSNIFFGKSNELNVPILMRKIVNPIEMIMTELVRCQFPSNEGTFYFDLEKGDWVAPGREGAVADLGIEYSCRVSEARTECRTKITFLSGGAYKRKKINSYSFKSEYRADTNEVYETTFLHTLSFDMPGRVNRILSSALAEDEYLVFRTRVVRDKDGKIISANYGKIYGAMGAFQNFGYSSCFFNPVQNDTNLEDIRMFRRYEAIKRQEEERSRKSWDIMGLFGK